MPGKSSHTKKKRFHQSKKSRAMQRFGTPAQPPAAVEATAKPEDIKVPAAPKKPAPAAKAITVTYPFITSELRRIGIIAGIIMAILIIAAIIIP